MTTAHDGHHSKHTNTAQPRSHKTCRPNMRSRCRCGWPPAKKQYKYEQRQQTGPETNNYQLPNNWTCISQLATNNYPMDLQLPTNWTCVGQLATNNCKCTGRLWLRIVLVGRPMLHAVVERLREDTTANYQLTANEHNYHLATNTLTAKKQRQQNWTCN